METRGYRAYETPQRLDQLEAEDGDCPLTLAEDLEIPAAGGMTDVSVLWQQYREVVAAGIAPPLRGPTGC